MINNIDCNNIGFITLKFFNLFKIILLLKLYYLNKLVNVYLNKSSKLSQVDLKRNVIFLNQKKKK